MSLHRTLLAVTAAVLLPAAAQAQYYSSVQQPPLYPYAAPANQPYAVQVAPNTYEIRRPARGYPYVNRKTAERTPPRFDRPHKKVDHQLVEELRQRSSKRAVINTKRIVREKPVVVETKRYVDDPPRIIERRHVVEDAPRTPAVVDEPESKRRSVREDGKKRVIHAEAEVTILGPDRMSIRLFRKGRGNSPRAEQN